MAGDAWGQYLDEIGRIPLLSRDQVTAAAQRIEEGERARTRLAVDPPAEADEVDALSALVADGVRAKHLLVTSNLRLVVAVARRFRPGSLTLPDLVQEGAFGLIRAVEKFDHRRGIAFSTYATWWIRQSMSRAVAEQARSVRVPKHVNDEMAACVRARDALADRFGHEPSVRDVAAARGIDEARASVLLRWASPADSLQEVVEEGCAPPGAAREPAEEALRNVEQAELRARLGAALDRLPIEHRTVLRHRVGWSDGIPRSLRSVAAALGVSRDVVRRLEEEAHDMLRLLPQLDAVRDWFDC